MNAAVLLDGMSLIFLLYIFKSIIKYTYIYIYVYPQGIFSLLIDCQSETRIHLINIINSLATEDIKHLARPQENIFFLLSCLCLSLFIIYILYFLKRKIKGFSCSTTCYYFRKFVSSFRPTRSGSLGPSIDTIGNIQIHELTCFKY